MRHLILLVSASVLVMSCGAPTAPQTSDQDRFRQLGGPAFNFILELPPNSTGTLHGMIFHGGASGGRQSGLEVRFESNQTHTLEGTLSGSGGTYRFQLWTKEGSLVPGSFKVLSGPVERAAACEAVFVNRTTDPGPFPIRVQFTVQDSFNGDCHTNY